LPEGRRLTAIASRVGASLDDDLTILLEIGQDLIGDVQVLEKPDAPDLEREVLLLPKDTSTVSFNEIRNSYFGLSSTGIPGVQDKVSSRMLNARARMANVDYILKLNPVDVPFAVENENFFLHQANKCDIEISEFQMFQDKENNHALRLERFDRVASKKGKTRLAVEDGCQALDIYPAKKYSVEFLELANGLIELCPSRVTAGVNLFKMLIFNWLIGNGDAHAKNFSVLESEGEWVVAPAYDLLCTRFYNDRDMALPLLGQKTAWTLELLLEAAEKMYVKRDFARELIRSQLSVLEDLPDQILGGALPFPRHTNIEVSEFLKKRRKALAL
jgi:serine/threonine-protein kinase HipA